jgi:PAS domain S-box-containing protein
MGDLAAHVRADQDGSGHEASNPRASILLVNDQPVRLLFYEALLSDLQIRCVRAVSGREAVAELLEQEISAILLDLSTPGWDGLEAARLLRSHACLERIPMLLVADADARELGQLGGYDDGVIDHMVPSLVPHFLRGKMATLVELSRTRRELRAVGRELQDARARLDSEYDQRKRGEARLRAIFEHPALITGVLEARRDETGAIEDWIVRDATANVIRIMGQTRETVIGRGLSEFHPHPDQAKRAAAVYARALATGEVTEHESRLAGRDYLVTSFAVSRDTVITSGIDITERKRSEALLRDSERRHRALLENAPVGVMHTAMNGRIEYVNQAFCRLVGYTAEELQGKTWQSITHPDDVRADEMLVKRVLAGEIPDCTIEKRYVRKDGASVWVNLFGNFVLDDGGRPVQGVGIVVDVTERHLAEQRLAAVLQSINDHLMCLDRQWRFTYLNETTARLLGRPRQELLGVCLWDLFPDTAIDYYRDLHTAAREQRIITAEHYSRRWNKWFENHIYPSAEGVTIFFSDVTQRKQSELALRESEERLTLARGAAHLGIYDRDLTTGNIQWDEFTRQLWGIGAEAEIRHEDFIAAVHPDDRAKIQAAVEGAMDPAGNGDYSATYRVTNRVDGITRWVEATGRVAFEGGRPVRLVGTLRDVTERVAADERLRASEERFRELANNIDQFAWTCDRLGYATWYNDRWYQYTGTTFKEMQGEGWKRIVHPAHVDRVMRRVPQCLQEGHAWEETFPVRSKDGQYRWFLSRAVPIHDANGQVTRWFGTNTDVTELRELQEALKEADRRKDEFLAMLAHELRNPLAAIRNATNALARKQGRDEAERALLGMIHRQGDQLARLLDDLLDAARITQGHIELRFERVALRSCIDLAVEIAAPLIREKHHKLVVEQMLEPIHVDADRVRLVQCIANVLINAAKYTDPNGEIRVHPQVDGARVLIAISDTGMGISEELLPRVFDLFTQGDRALDRSQGGLGIGLAICKRLIQMHGGDVVATSAGVGQGATFRIDLPLAEAPPASANEVPLPKARGVRVLIVDDNRDAADSLAMMLQLDGHQTRTAYSAEGALEAAGEFAPDFILLDIGLPRMDGYEVGRRLKLAGNPARLIALTGYGRTSDRQRSADAGFAFHLVKPVGLAALAEVLATHTARG